MIPEAWTGNAPDPAPGLPAVQQISRVKQEPRMKRELGHNAEVGIVAGVIKYAKQPCDILAPIAKIQWC